MTLGKSHHLSCLWETVNLSHKNEESVNLYIVSPSIMTFLLRSFLGSSQHGFVVILFCFVLFCFVLLLCVTKR